LENTVIREIVITTFYSGLRLSEVCNLKWSNIDFENELLKIGDGIFTTKSKRQRFIPICDSLKTLLLKKLEQSKVGTEYIFVKGNGYPFNIDYVSHKFKEAVKKTNLDQKIHFHSLRHSTASVLAKNGVPLFHIKEILGHSDQSTTQIYAHLQADDLKESIKKLES
jgi:integrase